MAGQATISGSVIQLTPINATDKWGRATYSETMHLWENNTGKVANFTTSFSFIISSEGADTSTFQDGFAFFLASPDFPPPILQDGSALGLVNRNQMKDSSFIAENKFVAVEFDTFKDDIWDDPANEHVGININNITSRETTIWSSRIKENRTYSSSVSYDPITQNLSVTFTGFTRSNSIPTPTKGQLSYIVDLRDHLPERVEFSFSASTGTNTTGLNTLCSWSFESTPPLLI